MHFNNEISETIVWVGVRNKRLLTTKGHGEIMITFNTGVRDSVIGLVPNAIALSTTIPPDSTALGSLFALLPVDSAGSANFVKSVYVALSRAESRQYQLSGISPGSYIVYAFHLGSSGRLKIGKNAPVAFWNAEINGQG